MQSPAWVRRLFQSRAQGIASPLWSWRTIFGAPGNDGESCSRDSARLSRCDFLLFAQLANRGELGREHRDLAFDRCNLLLIRRGAPRFLRALERLGCLGFV